MFLIDKRHLKNFDFVLLGILVVIISLGVIAIYSASFDLTTGSYKAFYKKQMLWGIMGVCGFLLFSFISYKRLVEFSYIFYVLGLALLIFVLIGGHVGMGAQRWINIGGFRLQPSEIFKLIFIIILARNFKDISEDKLGFSDIIKKSIILIAPFGLIFLQPDLGTAIIFLAVWGTILLYRGIKKATFITSLLLFLTALPILWLNLREYQKNRIITFLNPERDPFGAGYHVIQSKIAVGSGGLFGKGFLDGTQTHLKFLPERHTDFIFSLINEEFGFMGSMVLIALFLALIYRVFEIGNITKEPTAKIFCVAVASLTFFQVFVNASMTVAMMPVVGIPMPFISYGGSSLITFMSLMGIVNSIRMRRFDRPSDY